MAIKVRYFFEVTSHDNFFMVHGYLKDHIFSAYSHGCLIGSVMFYPNMNIWHFKTITGEDSWLFLGFTREEAVDQFFEYVCGCK